jgi:hypothetical protein
MDGRKTKFSPNTSSHSSDVQSVLEYLKDILDQFRSITKVQKIEESKDKFS